MKIKQVLDELFKDVIFDKELGRNLLRNNIEFITSTKEHKELFGGGVIGCYYISYTKYNKNIFYENLFGFDVLAAEEAIKKISTIPKSFKIARDDVNLLCFYIAHRFLSNKTLDKKSQMEYAKATLDYFSYRTLVLLSSTYWVYPISEEKAISLYERLNNKYIIKKLKNWNEYCQYRSTEYLNSKYLKLLITFNDDKDIPNAITDLFNRTKDTLKNIYREFLDMLENDEVISSRKNVMNDLEGEEVLADRLDDPSMYINKVENTLSDKSNFIKKDMVDVSINIVNSVSYQQLLSTLEYIYDFYFVDRKAADRIRLFIHDFLVNCFEYLQANKAHLSKDSNVISIVNYITGNVLYARGTDVTITKVKDDGFKLLKDVYKNSKVSITDRNLTNVRNAFCIYILLLALI